MTRIEKQWNNERLERIHRWHRQTNHKNFIDDKKIADLLDRFHSPDRKRAQDIIQKAQQNATSGKLLTPEDVATLVNVRDPKIWSSIFAAADNIKQTVYGNRIVLFAPLYVSSFCVNNCAYCGFRSSNSQIQKRQLTDYELRDELHALIRTGHKRLIMVYGEHSDSDHEYICQTVEQAYRTKEGNGEIRRANVNAAPFFEEEYKEVHSVGIGTYQVFQETYHRPTYEKIYPAGTLKGDYDWRLFALHRAQDAGIDDIGLGVLFGLYDWRFELLGLLYHTMSIETCYGIGPHTISYPRIEPAVNTPLASMTRYRVSDEDFKKIAAVIRLMCPYTGSILTAREPAVLRREIIGKGGVSQMDAGSRIGVGGYAQMEQEHLPNRQQFMLADTRSLDEFIRDLCLDRRLPSFCTAGYREGRTGAKFMPLAKHATVKNFCIPNGVLTFQEYLTDYASEETRHIGKNVIARYTGWIDSHAPLLSGKVKGNLRRMEQEAQRDLHF